MRTLRRSLPAVWAALIAVLLQLSLGQMAMAAHAARPGAQALAFTHICGEADGAAYPGHPAPHHGGMDCLQCPLCAALAVHAVVLPVAASVPAAPLAPAAAYSQPAQTASPNAPPTASFDPRGPPSLA